MYIVSRQNFSFYQDRKLIERVKAKTYNALSTANLIMEHAVHYQIDFGFDQMSDLFSSQFSQDSFVEEDEVKD